MAKYSKATSVPPRIIAWGEEEETWSCHQRNYQSFYENVGCPQLARNCQVSDQLWIPKIEVLAKISFINSSASM